VGVVEMTVSACLPLACARASNPSSSSMARNVRLTSRSSSTTRHRGRLAALPPHIQVGPFHWSEAAQ
jgi:hypothetical protein